MSGRRDRHDRGLRGPLALPNALTGTAVPLRRAPSRAEFFLECVSAAIARVGAVCPQALNGVDVGIEEVPYLATAWSGERVPLAAAIEATGQHPAQIVIYRRPLEHRAASRPDLRRLIRRTLAEQLSALTGLAVETIDPDIDPDEE